MPLYCSFPHIVLPDFSFLRCLNHTPPELSGAHPARIIAFAFEKSCYHPTYPTCDIPSNFPFKPQPLSLGGGSRGGISIRLELAPCNPPFPPLCRWFSISQTPGTCRFHSSEEVIDDLTLPSVLPQKDTSFGRRLKQVLLRCKQDFFNKQIS